MIALLVTGLTLGIYAGLSPGPMLTLVIAESLRGGWPAGVRVAMAPLFSDLPMIGFALWMAGSAPPWAVPAIGATGGLLMVWLGWGTIRAGHHAAARETAGAFSFWRGVAANLLNPNAAIFWLTTGASLLKDGMALGWAGLFAFVAPFYCTLVGGKVAVAVGVSGGSHRLQGQGYRWSLRIAGLFLALLGMLRIWQSLPALF